MATLAEKKQRRSAALTKAEGILATANTAGRDLTAEELNDVTAANTEAEVLGGEIAQTERLNTLRALNPAGIIPGAPREGNGEATENERAVIARAFGVSTARLSAAYVAAFAGYGANRGAISNDMLTSGGYDPVGGGMLVPDFAPRANAITYEGNAGAPGPGYPALPFTVDGNIIPLMPPKTGALSLVRTVTTTNDVRYPRQTGFGTAAVKAETTNSASPNFFGGTDPAVDSVTLSAGMIGHASDASWELLQDVGQWLAFIKDDQLNSLQQLKEQFLLFGGGAMASLLTGVDVGIAAQGADSAGNLFPAASGLDLLATLKTGYQSGASWLMNISTVINLWKQQLAGNRFNDYLTRQGDTWYFHGFPVALSDYMPTVQAGNTPALLGHFDQAYLLGERGGPGVYNKILDQPKATQGVLQVLSYQRLGGIIRRSEAVKSLTLHS